MKTTALRVATTLLALLWPAMAHAAGGQLTILGGQASGDYGSGTRGDRQSAALRFTLGDETQLRVDFELLRMSSELGVTQTPFGPVRTRQASEGSGMENAGQGGQSQEGEGQGGIDGGSSGADQDSATGSTAGALPAQDWVTGAGDLRLSVSRVLVGGSATLFRLDAEAGVKVPTADEESFLGTGELDYRLGLAAQYRFWAMTGFCGVGWNALGDPAWVELEDVAEAYVGLESNPLAGRVVISGWLEGNEEVTVGSGSRAALGLAVSGVRKIRWQAQIRAGLSGSSEDLSVLLGVSTGLRTPTIGSRRST